MYKPYKSGNYLLLNKRMKQAARKRVQYALKTGRLIKEPCETCGEADVEAHHPDYNEPLVVVWLCRPHHNELHAAERLALSTD